MYKALMGLAISLIVGVGLSSAGSALQDPNVLVIELSGVVRGAEGDVIEVYNEPVPENLVGASCVATATTANNSSIHPGNDLLITDANGVGRIENVEDEAGQVLNGSAPVVLGAGNLTISVELGPSGTSSGGVTLRLDCTPPAPPTTAPPSTTTPTTAPPTTAVSPASTAPPPSGGVDTGAGGLAVQGTSPTAVILVLGGLAGAVSLGTLRSRRRI